MSEKFYKTGTKVNIFVCISRVSEERKNGFYASNITEYTYHEFEGCDFRIPKDYDSVLCSLYGNYLEIPPEEERINKHRLKAYFLN